MSEAPSGASPHYYRALQPFSHGGKAYEQGDTWEIDGDYVMPALVELGWVEIVQPDELDELEPTVEPAVEEAAVPDEEPTKITEVGPQDSESGEDLF